MTDKTLVLVVEDDRAVRNLITATLNASQTYTILTAATGESAIMQTVSKNPDIIILDLGLPDMDGMEVIQKVRTWSSHPIIVVSARSEDRDKIDALDAGADDYLTKPFSVEELLARIRVAIRKMKYDNRSVRDEAVFENGGLKIDYSAALVYIDEQEVHLTPIEYKLLCLLAKNVGKVLTHNYILSHVWPNPAEADSSLVRVFMATLRKKIEEDPSNPVYIQTHIGIGYRMNRIQED
jgi:Response regulators consisting of a CheY-like receiver domain and a winged-helix DNA-binding domain